MPIKNKLHKESVNDDKSYYVLLSNTKYHVCNLTYVVYDLPKCLSIE